MNLHLESRSFLKLAILLLYTAIIAIVSTSIYGITICGKDCTPGLVVVLGTCSVVSVVLYRLWRAEAEEDDHLSERERELAELDRRIAEYRKKVKRLREVK